MKIVYTILCSLCFSCHIFATDPPQLQSPDDVLTIPDIHFLPTHLRATDLFIFATTSAQQMPLVAYFKPIDLKNKTSFRAWAYEDLAFFCKIEVQLERATKIPIKFRLGEVQQVERMEGKY